MPPMTHLQHPSQPSQAGTTQVETTPATQSQSHTPVLRLRGAHARDGRSVRWTDDVVNNEGLGRKKSKACCIYHRPRAVDESSSSDSSSDSSDSSDSGDEEGRDQNQDERRKARRHEHDGQKPPKHAHDCGAPGRQGRTRRRPGDQRRTSQPSPNAYEKMPKVKPKADAAAAGPSKEPGSTT